MHRLVLIGPPSSIFCLDWLNGCSDLELLQLRAYGEYGKHALSNSNEDLATPSTVSPNLVCPAALMTQPRTGSILKTVNIEGPGEYPRKFLELSSPCTHPMPSSSKLTSSKAIQCFHYTRFPPRPSLRQIAIFTFFIRLCHLFHLCPLCLCHCYSSVIHYFTLAFITQFVFIVARPLNHHSCPQLPHSSHSGRCHLSQAFASPASHVFSSFLEQTIRHDVTLYFFNVIT